MPSTSSKDNKGGEHKPLRQLAAEKVQGKGANPTLLGDPASLAVETTPDDNADGGKHAASGKDQTKADPADHDNGPSGSSGSVTKDSTRSKL